MKKAVDLVNRGNRSESYRLATKLEYSIDHKFHEFSFIKGMFLISISNIYAKLEDFTDDERVMDKATLLFDTANMASYNPDISVRSYRDSILLISSLVSKIMLYSKLKQYEKAVKYAERTLDIYNRINAASLGAGKGRWGRHMYATRHSFHILLGSTYFKAQMWDKAQNAFNIALAMRDEGAKMEDSVRLDIYYHLGEIHRQKGEYAEAEDKLNQALTLKDTVSGFGSENKARLYHTAALVYAERQNIHLANQYFDDALLWAEIAYGRNHAQVTPIIRDYLNYLKTEEDYFAQTSRLESRLSEIEIERTTASPTY